MTECVKNLNNQWYCLYCLLTNKDKQIEILTSLNARLFTEALPLEVFLYAESCIRKGLVPDKHLISSECGPEAGETLYECEGVDVDQFSLYLENLRSGYASKEIRELSLDTIRSKKIDKEEFLAKVNNLISSTTYSDQQGLSTIEEVVNSIDHEIENRIERPCINTGIESLDSFWDPIEIGEFVLMAGRPSMGKSAVLGYMVAKNSLSGVSSLIITMEMSKEQFVTRMFGSITEIPLWKFKNHKLTEEEHKKYKDHVPIFKQMPLVFVDSGSLKIDMIYSSIYKAKIKYPDLKLVTLDYIQLADVETSNIGIAELSKALKSMGKEFGVVMVAASQLNRLCEQRENKRPMMSDMRDSGSLEQDADKIVGLYNDYRYSADPNTKDLLEILVLKNRTGSIGKVMVEYEKSTQAIRRIKHGTQLYKTSEKFRNL